MKEVNKLLSAIVDDDPGRVNQLLTSDRTLATCLIEAPKLHDSGIFHWIYVGDTPLHLAAAGYRVEIVETLLKVGADPNSAKNMRKSNPFHYASDGYVSGPDYDPQKQVETLKLLLEKGAHIHSQDMNGATPLHRAVRTRCAAAVKFLLDKGADPRVRNKPGSTAFHLAVQNTGRGGSGEKEAIEAQREIIKEFLSRAVSIDLKDGKGKTVADCARSEWVRDLIEVRA